MQYDLIENDEHKILIWVEDFKKSSIYKMIKEKN